MDGALDAFMHVMVNGDISDALDNCVGVAEESLSHHPKLPQSSRGATASMGDQGASRLPHMERGHILMLL